MSSSITNRCEQFSKRSNEIYNKRLRFNQQNANCIYKNVAQSGLLRNKSSSYCSRSEKKNYLQLNQECQRKRRYREFLKAQRRRITDQNVRRRGQKMIGRSSQPQRRTCQSKNLLEPSSSEASTHCYAKTPKVATKMAGHVSPLANIKQNRFTSGFQKVKVCRQKPGKRSFKIQVALPRSSCSNVYNSNKKNYKGSLRGDLSIDLKAAGRDTNKRCNTLKTCLRRMENCTQTQRKMVEQAVDACFFDSKNQNPLKFVPSRIMFTPKTGRSSEDLIINNKNYDKKIYCHSIHNKNKHSQMEKQQSTIRDKNERLRLRNKVSFKHVPNSKIKEHISTCSCLTQTLGSACLSSDSTSGQSELRKKDTKQAFKGYPYCENKQIKLRRSPHPQNSARSTSSMCLCSHIQEEQETMFEYTPPKLKSIGSLLCNYFDFTSSKCMKAEEPSQSVTNAFREFAPYDAAPWPTPASCPFYRALRGLQIKFVAARNSGYYRNGLEAVVIKIAELEARMSYTSFMSLFEGQELENREKLLKLSEKQDFESKSKDKVCRNCKKLCTSLKTIGGLQKKSCFPALFESQRILMNEIINNINHCKNKCARSVFRTFPNLVCYYKNTNRSSSSTKVSGKSTNGFRNGQTSSRSEASHHTSKPSDIQIIGCGASLVSPNGSSLKSLSRTKENAVTSTCTDTCGKIEIVNPEIRTSFCKREDRGCNRSTNKFQQECAKVDETYNSCNDDFQAQEIEISFVCDCSNSSDENADSPLIASFEDKNKPRISFDCTPKDEVILKESGKEFFNNDVSLTGSCLGDRHEREIGTQYERSWSESDCSNNSLSSLFYCPIFKVIRGSSIEKSIDCFKIEDPSDYSLKGNNINNFCTSNANLNNFQSRNSTCGGTSCNRQSDSFTIIRTSSVPICKSDVLTLVVDDTELYNGMQQFSYDNCSRLRGGENKDEEDFKNNKAEENSSHDEPLPEHQQTLLIQSLSTLFTQELLDILLQQNLTNYVDNLNLSKVTEKSSSQFQNMVAPCDVLPLEKKNGGNYITEDINKSKEIGSSLLVNNEFSRSQSQNKLYHLPNIETELQKIISHINIRAKDLEMLMQSLDDKTSTVEEITDRREKCNEHVCRSEKELLCTDYTAECNQNKESTKPSNFQNHLRFLESILHDNPMEEVNNVTPQNVLEVLHTKIGNTSGFQKSVVKELTINNKGNVNKVNSIKVRKSKIKSDKICNLNSSSKERNNNSRKLLNFKRSSATSNVFLNVLREVVRTTKFNEETLRTLKNEFWLGSKTLKHAKNCDVYVVPRSFLLENKELPNLSEQTTEEAYIQSKKFSRKELMDNNKLLQEKLKLSEVNKEKWQDSLKIQERCIPQNFKTNTNPFLDDMSCEETLSGPQLNNESTQIVKGFQQSDTSFKQKEFGLNESSKLDYVNKANADGNCIHCIPLLTKVPEVPNTKISTTKLLKLDDKSGKESGEEQRIENKAIAAYNNLLHNEFNLPYKENKSEAVEKQRYVKSCAVGPSSVDIYLQIKQEKMKLRSLKTKLPISKYLRKSKISTASNSRRKPFNPFSFTGSISNSNVSSCQLREVNSHFELGVPIGFDNFSSTKCKLMWKRLITKYINRKPSVRSDWLDETDEMETDERQYYRTRRKSSYFRENKRVTNRNKSTNRILRHFNRKKKYPHPGWFGIQAKYEQNSTGLLEFVNKTDPKKVNELNNELQMKDVLQKSFLTEFFMRSRVAAHCGGTVKNIWQNTDIQTTASLVCNVAKPTQCEVDKSNKGEQCCLTEQADVRSFYIPQKGGLIPLQSNSSKNIGNSKRTSLLKQSKNPVFSEESTSNKADSIKCSYVRSSKELKKAKDAVLKKSCHIPKEIVVIFRKSDNARTEHPGDHLCEENHLNKRLHGSDRTEFSHVNFDARKQDIEQVFGNTTDHYAQNLNLTKTCGHGPKLECRYNGSKRKSFSSGSQPVKESDRLRMIGGLDDCSTCNCKPQRISSVGISNRYRNCNAENQIPIRSVSDTFNGNFDRRFQGRTFTCRKYLPPVKVNVKLQDSLGKTPMPERGNTRSTGAGSAMLQVRHSTGKCCKACSSGTQGNKGENSKKQKGLFKCCKKKKAQNSSEFSEDANKCIQAMGLLDRTAQTVKSNERSEGDVIEGKKAKRSKTKPKKDKNRRDSLKQSKPTVLDSEDDCSILLSCRPVGTGNKRKGRKKARQSQKLPVTESSEGDCSDHTTKSKTKIRLVNCKEIASSDCSEDLPDDSDSCQKQLLKIIRCSTNKNNMNCYGHDVSKLDGMNRRRTKYERQNNKDSSEDNSENVLLLKCVDKEPKKYCKSDKKGSSKNLLFKVLNRERGGECRKDKTKEVKPKRKFFRRKKSNEIYPIKVAKDDSTNGLESRDSSFLCVEVAASTHQKQIERIREKCKKRKKLCVCKQSPYEECEHTRRFLRTCKCHNHCQNRKCNSHHSKKCKPHTGLKKMLSVKVGGDIKKHAVDGCKSKSDDCIDKSLVCVRIPKSRDRQKNQQYFNQEEYKKQKILAEKSAQCTVASYSNPENLPQTFIEQFFTPCENYSPFPPPRSNIRQQNLYPAFQTSPPEKENPLPQQYFGSTISPRFIQNYDCYPMRYSMVTGAYSKYGNHTTPCAENVQKFHIHSCNPHESPNHRNLHEYGTPQPELIRKKRLKYCCHKIPIKNDSSSYRIYNTCMCASKRCALMKNDVTESASSTITGCSDGRRSSSKYYTHVYPDKKTFTGRHHNTIRYTDSNSQTNRKTPIVKKIVKYVDSETSMDLCFEDRRRFFDNERFRGGRCDERSYRRGKNSRRKYYDGRRDYDERESNGRRRRRNLYYDDYY